MPFLQKKSVQLTFSSRRTANCKVPSRIGGHHFLLCQQTNTKDITGQSANMNMTQVTINVSLSSGHSEGELYFLEGERGKALGVEHRSPPRFRRPKLTAFQERMGSDASWGGSSRCFSGHRRIKDKPHNLVQVHDTNVKISKCSARVYQI